MAIRFSKIPRLQRTGATNLPINRKVYPLREIELAGPSNCAFLCSLHRSTYSSSPLILTVGDYQIRLNDHPYAFEPDVTHIVVWSALRFPAEVSTQERMVRCEKFVEEHFGEIPVDNRRWFLNWGSIQSVPGLEV
jgi:hypothetical protein